MRLTNLYLVVFFVIATYSCCCQKKAEVPQNQVRLEMTPWQMIHIRDSIERKSVDSFLTNYTLTQNNFNFQVNQFDSLIKKIRNHSLLDSLSNVLILNNNEASLRMLIKNIGIFKLAPSSIRKMDIDNYPFFKALLSSIESCNKASLIILYDNLLEDCELDLMQITRYNSVIKKSEFSESIMSFLKTSIGNGKLDSCQRKNIDLLLSLNN